MTAAVVLAAIGVAVSVVSLVLLFAARAAMRAKVRAMQVHAAWLEDRIDSLIVDAARSCSCENEVRLRHGLPLVERNPR